MPGAIAEPVGVPTLIASPATELVVEQGSDEWLEARLGLATASEFVNIMAKNKGNTESSLRRNYRAQLVVERLTHRQADRFKSAAMQFGNDTEDLAATAYMLKTGLVAVPCGIFIHNEYKIGDSPDRLVEGDGAVEIKCLNTANHIDVLRAGTMPTKHKPQVQGHMWMTGRAWCDFVSFDPDLPEAAQIFIERQYRDETYIAEMEASILEFLAEVEAEVSFLESYVAPELAL